MTSEIEFPAGTTKETIKAAEMEYRKDQLAHKFGWTREKLDEELENIKEFLTPNKKKRNLEN